MEALADMDAVPSWSSVHKRVEVVDKHPDGRPHHVKVTIRVTGIIDTEMLEYHWGPDWMVWDAEKTVQQHGQHGEYNLPRGRRQDPGAIRHHRGTVGAAARVFGQSGAQEDLAMPRSRDCASASWAPTIRVSLDSGSVAQRGQSLDRLVEGVVAFAESEAHQVIPHCQHGAGRRIAERRHRDGRHADLFR